MRHKHNRCVLVAEDALKCNLRSMYQRQIIFLHKRKLLYIERILCAVASFLIAYRMKSCYAFRFQYIFIHIFGRLKCAIHNPGLWVHRSGVLFASDFSIQRYIYLYTYGRVKEFFFLNALLSDEKSLALRRHCHALV